MPQTHDIVVVGASAGGIEALGELAAALPLGLPAARPSPFGAGRQDFTDWRRSPQT